MVNKYRENNLKVEELLQFQKNMEQLNWMSLGLLKKELHLISEKSVIKYNKRAILNFIYDVDGMPEIKYRLLKEALVHLIRNSIAHGIEDISVRKARKKEEAGRINIHIYQENNTYTVLYSDDGAGFDIEKIRERVIKTNMASPGTAAGFSENELIGYIFKSGFSTLDETDMIAGVGIGMSVVKNNIIHSLKGLMKIKNRPERGISITMSFP
jgi:two-component system chemotaxis sensor kinase CheA